MKRILTTIFVTLVCLPLWSQTPAELENSSSLDFQNDGIWYTVLNEVEKTCLTKSGSIALSGGIYKVTYGNTYTGALTIPQTVQKDGETYTVVAIGNYAFDKVASISLPSSIVQIGEGAFFGNATLESINIPETVTIIGKSAFAACSSLSSVTLPPSITSIESSTFAECTNLKTIDIPSSVTYIGDYAFSETALSNIVIPGTVNRMGKIIFQGCSMLASVTIEEGITSISASMFSGCRQLSTITIPSTVKAIGSNAFYGCHNLKEVISLNPEPPAISSDSFSSATLSGTLKVYNTAYNAYSKSNLWGKFATIEKISVEPNGIVLDKSSLSIYLGLKGQLTANLMPTEATGEIIWDVTSDPEGVVEIDNSGKLIAHKVGTAIVTASCGEYSAVCNVTVLPNSSERVTINRLSNDLYVGDVVTMSAIVLPTTITSPIIWSSSNPGIIQIDENSGQLTAVAAGTAIITAQCENIIDKMAVTVMEVPVSSITLNKASLTLKTGENETLVATILPEKASNTIVIWESSDTSVAYVYEGVVTAVGTGFCTIRAKCGEIVANCDVSVEPIQAESITLSETDITLKANQINQLHAIVMPETTTDKTIVWMSDNEQVATVTMDGIVRGISVGTANISAECGSVKAICKVTVIATEADEVVINYPSLTMRVAQTQQLTASVADNVTDKTIVWATDNPSIVTVKDGLVTAVGIGNAVISASCGSASATCNVTVEATPAENIVLSSYVLALDVDSSEVITAEVYPETTTDKTLLWSSNHPEIAIVEDGVITGVATGSAIITAECGDVSARCNVTVMQPARSIVLNRTDITLEIGDVEDLIATVNPEDTTDELIWTTSDSDIAIVNECGIVEAISEGFAIITAKCGDVKAECAVNVIPVAVESVVLSVETLTLKVSQSQQLTAVVLPDNVMDKTVIWTTDNEQVAVVSEDGMVTGIDEGFANITATCGSVSAICVVTVEQLAETEIVINYSEVTLREAQTWQLVAMNNNANVIDGVKWNSSDNSVATISEYGLVTAEGVGQATITATCGDSTATCIVIVEATPSERIELSETDVELNTGETIALVAIVYPDTATDKNVIWLSTDSDVADVSEDGVVSANAPGNAIITAINGNVFAQCHIIVISDGDDSVQLPEEIQVTEETYRVYTLSGFNVMTTKDKNDLKQLQSGFYIINGKKFYIIRK